MPTTHREPLCLIDSVTIFSGPRHARSGVGVTRPSSLILAHAPDQNPLDDFSCPYFDKSLQVATSPCWEMALPDVISAIFAWALGSVPRHDRAVHLSVSFYSASVSPKGQEDRLVRYSHKTASCGGNISRLQPFAHVQAPILAWPSDCPDRGIHPLSHRAVYTGQNPFRYRIQAPASLRVRIRTIDTAGLAVDLTTTHLLDPYFAG